MRECDFVFDGICSNEYNLKLVYIKNDNEDFTSGGQYDIYSESVPNQSEQNVYGRKEQKPLEFEIEILRVDGGISVYEMTEIKNWLFSSNVPKRFSTCDEFSDYYINCFLNPTEDITDGLGYRGVRCKVVTTSPYWHQDVSIVYTGTELWTDSQLVNDKLTKNSIVLISTANIYPTYPTIEIVFRNLNSGESNYDSYGIQILNNKNLFSSCALLNISALSISGTKSPLGTKMVFKCKQGYVDISPRSGVAQGTRDYFAMNESIPKNLYFTNKSNNLNFSIYGTKDGVISTDVLATDIETLTISYVKDVILGAI